MTRTHEFNLTGAARKPLIEAIEGFTKVKGVYQGAPKFGYAFYGVGVLDKAGALHLDCDMQVIMDLVTWLEDCGFECSTAAAETEEAPAFEELQMTEREELGLGQERRDYPGEDGMLPSDVPDGYSYRATLSDPGCPACPERVEIFTACNDTEAYKEACKYCTDGVTLLELHQYDLDGDFMRTIEIDIQKLAEENGLCDTITVEIPKNGGLPDEKMQNLVKLAESKRSLLAKALGAPLTITDAGDTVQFVFPYGEETGIADIYGQLAAAMVRHVKKHQRVNATEREVESEKFAMRTFLVKLGMNGAEYSAARKYYSRNLTGNASFSKDAKYAAMQESRRNADGTEASENE